MRQFTDGTETKDHANPTPEVPDDIEYGVDQGGQQQLFSFFNKKQFRYRRENMSRGVIVENKTVKRWFFQNLNS